MTPKTQHTKMWGRGITMNLVASQIKGSEMSTEEPHRMT